MKRETPDGAGGGKRIATGRCGAAAAAPARSRGKRPGRRRGLNNSQIGRIRKRYAAGGVTQRQLGMEHGVSQAIISVYIRKAGIKRPPLIPPATVEEARARYAEGQGTQKQLAKRHGVSEMAMSRALRGIKPPPVFKPCGPCARDRCTVHLPKTLGRRTKKVYPHGTNARYVMGGCRCGPCRVAARTYNDRRNRLRAYGRFDGYVDAGPARVHLRKLSEAGIGPKSVSRACGVPASNLSRVMGSRARNSRGIRGGGAAKWRVATYRPIRRMRRSTLEKILAVTVSDCRPPAGLVSQEESDQARTRLEDLIAHGVKRWRIAVYLDPDLQRYVSDGRRPGLQLLRRTGRMTRKHFEAIERLYFAFFRARKAPTPEERRALDRRAA
jgi:hypothetical protein